MSHTQPPLIASFRLAAGAKLLDMIKARDTAKRAAASKAKAKLRAEGVAAEPPVGKAAAASAKVVAKAMSKAASATAAAVLPVGKAGAKAKARREKTITRTDRPDLFEKKSSLDW